MIIFYLFNKISSLEIKQNDEKTNKNDENVILAS